MNDKQWIEDQTLPADWPRTPTEQDFQRAFDHYAAAALTGLLANAGTYFDGRNAAALEEEACEIAMGMLAERVVLFSDFRELRARYAATVLPPPAPPAVPSVPSAPAASVAEAALEEALSAGGTPPAPESRS